MEKESLLRAQQWVQSELDRCIEFWLRNGMDHQHGGVYTCLDRKGTIYSTDKSVWMQGRCGWIFAWLCNMYGEREQWRKASKSCLDFMEDHCFNSSAGGRMYFTVTGDGHPLRQRRYYYSESFYAIANAEYYGLTGDTVYLDRALKAYDRYWNLWHGAPDPVGMPPKTMPDTRSMRSFGVPMICLNITNVLMRVDMSRTAFYRQRAEACLEDIFRHHCHPELSGVLENTGPAGQAYLDVTEGRIVNPGHDIEGVWFILEYMKLTGCQDWLEKAEQIFQWAVEAGWDAEYGGLLYFIDILGRPPESYEHDMKLWWPHCELMIASLMLYRDTGKKEYLDWFFKALDYCKTYFSDPDFGEWYGYLRRDGKPTMPPCKGSTFKGPFHLPRMLGMVDMIIQEILQK